ncbi:hypothetical protein DFH06DRAFT_1481556 [Mycena polygramma]|nr:hypothetical protein DFH06DRAFT_1481556 [Mycena polygramma]
MSDPPPSYNSAGSHLERSADKKSTSPDSPAGPSIAGSSRSPLLLQPHGNRSLRNSTSITGLFDVFRRNRHAPGPVAALDIKTAILDDIRLIIQPNTRSVAERLALLESCAELWGRHKLDLSALLQSSSSALHDHTTLYWVIVNELYSPPAPFELVAALLAHSQPLNEETIKDNVPEFGALSEANRFIMGLVVPPEDIRVEIIESPEQAFSVNFRIPMFLKRMMLSKIIEVEFIARECLWRLSFYKAGSHPGLIPRQSQEWINKRWGGHLKLCENSPATQLEIGVVILDARTTAQPAHTWTHIQPSLPFRNEDDSPSDSTITGWMWPAFDDQGPQADNVCIASDGSITGILGVKLQKTKQAEGAGTEAKSKIWPLTDVPTKPDDKCLVC